MPYIVNIMGTYHYQFRRFAFHVRSKDSQPRRRNYSNMKSRISEIPDRFFGEFNVSRHEYKWILNNNTTCREDVYLIVTIASAIKEFERRKIIRQTWSSVNNAFNKTIKYVFFVGNNGDKHVNEKLREESYIFGDIIQEDYIDSYRNLTIKTQGQLKWVTEYCSKALYGMHVDDDVVVNIKGIVKELLMLSKERYPLACVGWCFVMSQDIVNDLYYMSINTVLFHLEDVYTTGILREKINLKLLKLNSGESLCQHKGWPKDRPVEEKIIETWGTLNKQS